MGTSTRSKRMERIDKDFKRYLFTQNYGMTLKISIGWTLMGTVLALILHLYNQIGVLFAGSVALINAVFFCMIVLGLWKRVPLYSSLIAQYPETYSELYSEKKAELDPKNENDFYNLDFVVYQSLDESVKKVPKMPTVVVAKETTKTHGFDINSVTGKYFPVIVGLLISTTLLAFAVMVTNSVTSLAGYFSAGTTANKLALPVREAEALGQEQTQSYTLYQPEQSGFDPALLKYAEQPHEQVNGAITVINSGIEKLFLALNHLIESKQSAADLSVFLIRDTNDGEITLVESYDYIALALNGGLRVETADGSIVMSLPFEAKLQQAEDTIALSQLWPEYANSELQMHQLAVEAYEIAVLLTTEVNEVAKIIAAAPKGQLSTTDREQALQHFATALAYQAEYEVKRATLNGLMQLTVISMNGAVLKQDPTSQVNFQPVYLEGLIGFVEALEKQFAVVKVETVELTTTPQPTALNSGQNEAGKDNQQIGTPTSTLLPPTATDTPEPTRIPTITLTPTPAPPCNPGDYANGIPYTGIYGTLWEALPRFVPVPHTPIKYDETCNGWAVVWMDSTYPEFSSWAIISSIDLPTEPHWQWIKGMIDPLSPSGNWKWVYSDAAGSEGAAFLHEAYPPTPTPIPVQEQPPAAGCTPTMGDQASDMQWWKDLIKVGTTGTASWQNCYDGTYLLTFTPNDINTWWFYSQYIPDGIPEGARFWVKEDDTKCYTWYSDVSCVTAFLR